MGLPNAPIRRIAKGARGQRTPIVPVPAVTRRDTFSESELNTGRIRVSGPGQNLLVSNSVMPETLEQSTIWLNMVIESTRTRIGLDSGRPLISKIRRIAD